MWELLTREYSDEIRDITELKVLLNDVLLIVDQFTITERNCHSRIVPLIPGVYTNCRYGLPVCNY